MSVSQSWGWNVGHLARMQAPLNSLPGPASFTYWEVRLRKAVSQRDQTALLIQFVYPSQGNTQSCKESQKKSTKLYSIL